MSILINTDVWAALVCIHRQRGVLDIYRWGRGLIGGGPLGGGVHFVSCGSLVKSILLWNSILYYISSSLDIWIYLNNRDTEHKRYTTDWKSWYVISLCSTCMTCIMIIHVPGVECDYPCPKSWLLCLMLMLACWLYFYLSSFPFPKDSLLLCVFREAPTMPPLSWNIIWGGKTGTSKACSTLMIIEYWHLNDLVINNHQ